jgi:hypothetical protein
MIVKRTSMMTGKQHEREIDVDPEMLLRWEKGEGYVQTMFPHLSADDREYLISGATPEEWKNAFGDE